MKTYLFHAMSTNIQLGITSHIDAELLHQIEIWLEAIENTCSRFRKNSELSQLNNQVGKEASVSFPLYLVLEKALEFYEDTGGIFNPGVLSALQHEGYTQSIEQIRDKEVAANKNSSSLPVTTCPFTLHPDKHAVTLHTPIDLGGIAKGWALDYIAALLEPHADGFLNFGGDIRIFGTLSRELRIGVEDPFSDDSIISSFNLTSGALATSTSAKRKWLKNGEWHHHLIDPFTGQSAKSTIISATVTAPTAVQADVWAKVVLLLGDEKGKDWIQSKGVHAVLIDKNRNIWKDERQ